MTHEPRRLLFTVNYLEFFLSHRLPIALAAHRAGWEVHLATGPEEARNGPLPSFLHHHSITLSPGGTAVVDDVRTLAALYRAYRRIRPTVVHNVTMKPVIYGGIAARLAGVPAVVGAVSGLGYVYAGDTRKHRALQALVSGLYRLALAHGNSRVIFQNLDDRAALEGARALQPGQSLMIRGSGVDLNLYAASPEPDGVPVVLMTARLLWEKGVREFVEAARIVKQSIECRFLLAGGLDPGNPSALGEADLRPWVEDGTIEWLGYRTDVPELLALSNLYVLPSYYGEGLPKALIEAAATGRALVTTDMPGCRDVVVDGENGILVPPRNSEALARAISTLLRDPERRRRMGHASRRRAEEEFSLDDVVRRHLDIYRELADHPIGKKS